MSTCSHTLRAALLGRAWKPLCDRELNHSQDPFRRSIERPNLTHIIQGLAWHKLYSLRHQGLEPWNVTITSAMATKNITSLPSGGYAVTTYSEIRVYSVSGIETAKIQAGSHNVAVLPDGTIATIGNDHQLSLWSESGQLLQKMDFPRSRGIISSGNNLIIGCGDSLVLGDFEDRTFKRRKLDIYVDGLYALPHGKFIICSLDGALSIWSFREGHIANVDIPSKVKDVKVINQQGDFATLSRDAVIRFWSNEGELIGNIPGCERFRNLPIS